MSILKNMLEREFGINTREQRNPLVAVVGVAPVRVLSNNPDRLAWTIINLSGSDIALNFDRTVGPLNCILLGAGGGGVNFVWDEEFELVGTEVWAVAPIAGCNILALEIIAERDTTKR
jgi:hypothetical protein